ncbi:MAG TPA: hypothetical protein VGM29_02250 [Polyangiaceae bacterium]|jgi:hypothetical protein
MTWRSARRFGEALGIGLCFAAPARAEPNAARDPVGAEAIFNDAKRLLTKGDWQGACEKFAGSFELDPAVSTLVKIAKCREHEGKLASAWYEYQRALKLNRELASSELRRQELEHFIGGEVDKLLPRVPKLRVVLDAPPAGVELTRDGKLMTLDESIPVDPGEHVLVVSAPGYAVQTQTVSLSAGQTLSVPFKLDALPPAIAPANPGAPPPASPPVLPPTSPAPGSAAPVPSPQSHAIAAPAHSAQRDTGWILLGVGAAGLAESALLGWRTLSLVSTSNGECPSAGCSARGLQMRSDARELQTLSIVSGIAGALSVGTGVVLISLASSADASDARASTLRVTLGPNAIAARGSF